MGAEIEASPDEGTGIAVLGMGYILSANHRANGARGI